MSKRNAPSRQAVSSPDQIPEGWQPLASLGSNSAAAKYLGQAHLVNGRKVRAMRLMRTDSESKTGPVYFHPEDFDELLSQYQGFREMRDQQQMAAVKRCEVRTEATQGDAVEQLLKATNEKLDRLIELMS